MARLSPWCVLLVGIAAGSSAESLDFGVPGLEQPAQIRVDRWGVPHIDAATHYDAFFVQGFNAARDRLWQIDLWRRAGLGRLSEVLGDGYLAQDRAARLFLFRGDMYREWLAYGSDAKLITERFVAGVNAYVDLTGRVPGLLPPEFELLGYRPDRWRAEDVVRIRVHGLWRNVTDEVQRARVLCHGGAAADLLRKPLEPSWQITVPAGTEVCGIPDDVLRDYLLAKKPVSFDSRKTPLPPDPSQSEQNEGSNNWAVAPHRSATGRPILADDPHRAHAVPSLRYMVHLRAPGLDVIGGGEPALPGISIGHNGKIAFGLTIFPIDQEDLYVYETNPAGTHYRYRGTWLPFETMSERVATAKGDSRDVALEFTRHGPVLKRDAAGHRAYALRAAWLEPGMAPYFGSVEYMRAGNWREFLGALNRWGAPSENQVYADTDGNIGYKPAGLFPRRRTWDGLLPVAGDGRYEWDGYFDMDALPVEFNPTRGFVATANAMNLPEDYPIAERRVGFEWTAPWRHRRLQEVLASQTKHSIADSLALQRDYTSLLARDVITVLPKLSRTSARALLEDWDSVLAPDSAAAALFAIWYERHLRPALAAHLIPAKVRPLIETVDSRVVADVMRAAPAELIPAIEASLAAAWRDTQQTLGNDPAAWRWGDLHQIRFTHPLLPRAPADLAAAMQYPPLPRGGSADTPNNTGYANAKNFDVATGASFRIVVDVGNWDAARMTNAPGQSGDPRSPFYRNLLAGWANDESYPLVYSQAAIAEHTVLTIRLTPQQPASEGKE